MSKFSLSSNASDLVDAIRAVLSQSSEPLTITKIHDRLPAAFRAIGSAELTEVLRRQVAAHVFVMCPKYRSGQDRYWDRSLREHAKVLLREALDGAVVSWSELRKRLPKYLRHLAESVLSEQLASGSIYRHPPATIRMGPRYALYPPEVRAYASKMLTESLQRLEEIGFVRAEAREAMMQLLHEEEWSAYEPVALHAQHSAVNSMPARRELWNTPFF